MNQKSTKPHTDHTQTTHQPHTKNAEKVRMKCPNCESIWNEMEIKKGECFMCGYPNADNADSEWD